MDKRYILSFIVVLFLGGCGHTQYSIIQEDNKVGVINQDGYVVVKPTYKHIFNFDSSDNSIDSKKLSS
jgi:hypothetical protein